MKVWKIKLHTTPCGTRTYGSLRPDCDAFRNRGTENMNLPGRNGLGSAAQSYAMLTKPILQSAPTIEARITELMGSSHECLLNQCGIRILHEFDGFAISKRPHVSEVGFETLAGGFVGPAVLP
jgi:hypothetical protein